MNATSRAISLGKQLAPKRPTLEDELRKPENTQPYVDLMGRRIPVVAKEDETWRAVRESGEICKPGRVSSFSRLRPIRFAFLSTLTPPRFARFSFSTGSILPPLLLPLLQPPPHRPPIPHPPRRVPLRRLSPDRSRRIRTLHAFQTQPSSHTHSC